ncbi:glycosyltransferase family 2 protein [Leifsonia virtsii]|uniref:Glycosyltransferase family 2 protein n=1 Tax=Leifsonia virtsii TaxID=3035915 RepID=A0ABT8IZZ4_9MICO|nr:glycosyltransferase family 2 protein [Leifsonia virtsii]MDN4598401.1 glycosyltransferase family 2 protein [Leifsonia virtsii]
MSFTVGIALCTFNGERFIERQLESILAQRPAPDEVVVSDDGSIDSTLERVEAVAARAPVPLTVLRGSKPLGVTANFERAVRATSSDLIALSDQDDVWHEGRLARLVREFDDPAVLLVHTDARLVDSEGESLGRSLFESLEVTREELGREQAGDAYTVFLRRNLATGATVILRRSLLDDALPFPPGWVHDEWLAAVAAARGGVRVLTEATIDYRQHGANQIGVAAPTLARKVRRVLEPRGERNVILASRFATLADRLDGLDGIAEERLASAREKAAFEAERAAMPASRLPRARHVLRLARTGAYERFASRGRADILRDLIQPA